MINAAAIFLLRGSILLSVGKFKWLASNQREKAGLIDGKAHSNETKKQAANISIANTE